MHGRVNSFRTNNEKFAANFQLFDSWYFEIKFELEWNSLQFACYLYIRYTIYYINVSPDLTVEFTIF